MKGHWARFWGKLIKSGLCLADISDHLPIFCTMANTLPANDEPRFFRDLRHFNENAFHQDLLAVDFKGLISNVITHPLIFEWFYWLLYVTWCKSPDSYHAITPARVDICPPIVSVEEKHSKRKNVNFSFLLFNMEGNQTNVIESSDSDIKKLMASVVP